MKRSLLLSALLLTACATSPAHIEQAGDTATAFCKITPHENGMLNQILLTPDLAYTVRRAEAINALLARRNPGEKPPLGDGVPWQAYPDAAAPCVPTETFTIDGTRYVGVRYDIPGEPRVTWTDRLALKPVDGEWKVDNVLYGPDYTYTLRDALYRVR